MQAISSKNEHRKMQDSLSFTFCWGETFDTPPFPLKVTMSSLYEDWVMRLALTQRTPSH